MEFRWSAMLWQFQGNSEETQPYIDVYSFYPNSPLIQAAIWHSSGFPVLYSTSLLGIHFKYINVYMSILNSLLIPYPHSFPLINRNLFSKSVSLFLFYKFICIIFLDYAYRNITICFSFFVWHHSVWQSLGPSLLLQMALCHSFSWLSNIPLYICTAFSLSIPLSVDIWVDSVSWLL